MRVLLLGEFSGLFQSLAEGLRECGATVDWYANGDGYKAITGMTGSIDGTTKNHFINRIWYPFQLIQTLKGYDVVHVMNPLIFSPYINAYLFRILKKNNKRLVMSTVGTDYAVYQYQHKANRKYDYYLLDENTEYDYFYKEHTRYVRDYEKVMTLIDGIIPGSMEYYYAHENNPKLTSICRHPINTSKIEYTENRIQDKIVIFHGISREVFKGTAYIKAAMEAIGEKYPDDVEIIIDGKMPIEEYKALMARANIVIDQCRSYGQGINALIALAQGKIVLSGAEEECMDKMGVQDCPVYNIIANKEQIMAQLEEIIARREEFIELGKRSRAYVEKYHHHKLIAQDFMEVYQTILEFN
ncbi:MAG: hypothetical protein R3Y67_00270 [Eubacteriales bacterium]